MKSASDVGSGKPNSTPSFLPWSMAFLSSTVASKWHMNARINPRQCCARIVETPMSVPVVGVRNVPGR